MNCAAKKVECLQVAQKKNTIIRGPEYIYTASEDFKINKKKLSPIAVQKRMVLEVKEVMSKKREEKTKERNFWHIK